MPRCKKETYQENDEPPSTSPRHAQAVTGTRPTARLGGITSSLAGSINIASLHTTKKLRTTTACFQLHPRPKHASYMPFPCVYAEGRSRTVQGPISEGMTSGAQRNTRALEERQVQAGERRAEWTLGRRGMG